MLAAPATHAASFANMDDVAEAGRIVAATTTAAILAANAIAIASEARKAPTDATDATDATDTEAATISLAAGAARAAETRGDAAEATTVTRTRPKRRGTNASTVVATGRAVPTPVTTKRDQCHTMRT
jgi:hypothetical protein